MSYSEAELRQAEADLINLLGDVFNAIVDLPEADPMEHMEFAIDIHRIQDRLAARQFWRQERNRAAQPKPPEFGAPI